MDCKNIKDLIPLYLEDELQTTETKQVSEHLNQCVHCHELAQDLEKTWDLLDEIEDIQPSPNYVSQFWTRLSSEKNVIEQAVETLKGLIKNRKLAPIYVTACLIVVASLFALRNITQVQDPAFELASLNANELEIIENLEIAQDYEFIDELDFLANLDVIEDIEITQTENI